MPVNILAVILYYYSFIYHKILVLNVFYPFITIDRDQFLLIYNPFFGGKKQIKAIL